MTILLAAAFFALFFRWFYTQHLISWQYTADWGHSYFVPLISGYLIWQRREELAIMRPRPFWPALAPMALGIIAYVLFVATRFTGGQMVQGWAMILTLLSLTLLMVGPRMIRPLFLPIVFLVFGVTISQQVMTKVTAPLQIIASQGAYAVLNIIGAVSGFTVEIGGTVLKLVNSSGKEVPLNVAEACAGMRMVVAFFALSGATALLACRHWWQRIALLLMAAPVAIAVNIGRVAVLGLLSLGNQDLSQGQMHMLIGDLLLIPGLLLFLLVVWILNRLVRDERREAPA